LQILGGIRRCLSMSSTQQLPAVHSVVTGLLAELYAKCSAEKIGLTPETLVAILCDVGHKYLSVASTETEIRAFFLSLHVEELALARACAAGNNLAWEIFLTRYREKLYQAALRIAREDSAARELADTLYADLYGTSTREGERVSKLSSYTGRGSLEGWLRTVLAQEHVNHYRRTRRLVSLDEESEEGTQFPAAESKPAATCDERLESATDEALAFLDGEDRMILSAYYLDGRTLAEIARMVRVHESTISRRLDRLAKSLRKRILSGMVRRGMARRQAEEALEVDVRDVQLDIRGRLAQDSPPPAFSERRLTKVTRQAPGAGLNPDSKSPSSEELEARS
jgi:RNA polymerase sigma-70 factor (ECF subfamily)